MSVAIAPPLSTPFNEKDLLNILTEIQSNPPPPEALAHAQDVIADTAAGTTFRERILEEIRNLAETVLQLEAKFAKITLAIHEFDDKKAVRDKDDVPIEFLPMWTSYHEVR